MFSGQFYEKRLSVRGRNMKFLLETVTYIAIKEKPAKMQHVVTCIILLFTNECEWVSTNFKANSFSTPCIT